MTDKYAQLVNHGLGRNVAGKLGLPQPAVLRRYEPGQPLATGPVLVLGAGKGAESLAAELLAWDLDVRRHAVPRETLGAIVLVLDEVAHPEDLEKPVLTAAASLRDLGRNGRIITVSRPAAEADGKIVSRELLSVAVSRTTGEGDLRSVDALVGRLHRKLSACATIVTAPGFGYRLQA